MAGDTTELWLIVTNSSTAPITVNGFQLTIPPEGSNADELTADIAAIHAIGPDGWSTSPGPAFRFIPTGGTLVFQPDDSIQLRLTNVKVNATPGPVTFSISDGTTPPSSITLTKLPPGFRLSPLTAVPTTATGYPGSTSLSWTGPPLDSPYAPGYSLSWVVDGDDGDDTKTASGLPAVATHYAIDGLTHESTTITLTVAYTVDEQPASAIRQITVSVPVPAPKATLTITPPWYGPNDQISLAWQVEHSSAISIEPNLGTVDPTGNQAIGLAATAPTYTLSADPLPGYAGGGAKVSARPAPYSLVTTSLGDTVSPAGLAVSPDGSTLYIADDYGGMSSQFLALDAAGLNQVGSGEAFGRPGQLAVSPDGKWLYSLSNNGDAVTRNGLPGFTVDQMGDVYLPGDATVSAMSPDGTWLVAAGGGSIWAVDLIGWKSGASATFDTTQSNVESVAIAPDSTAVYVVGGVEWDNQNRTVTRYAGPGLTPTATTSLHVDPAQPNGVQSAVAVAPDGASIVVIVGSSLFRLATATMTITVQAQLPFLLPDIQPSQPTGAMRWVGRWIFIGTGPGDGSGMAPPARTGGLLVVEAASLTLAWSSKAIPPVTVIAVSADGRSMWWNCFIDDDDEAQTGLVSVLHGIPQ